MASTFSAAIRWTPMAARSTSWRSASISPWVWQSRAWTRISTWAIYCPWPAVFHGRDPLRDHAPAQDWRRRDRPTTTFAMALGRARLYDEARRQLEAAVRADPELADAQILLAEMPMAGGEAQAALPHLRKASAPANPTVRERAADAATDGERAIGGAYLVASVILPYGCSKGKQDTSGQHTRCGLTSSR